MQLHITTSWHGQILEEGMAPHASLTFAILGAAEKKLHKMLLFFSDSDNYKNSTTLAPVPEEVAVCLWW